MKKALIIIGIVVVLGIAAYFLFFRKKNSANDSPEAKPDQKITPKKTDVNDDPQEQIETTEETETDTDNQSNQGFFDQGNYSPAPYAPPTPVEINQAQNFLSNIATAPAGNTSTVAGQGKGTAQAPVPATKIAATSKAAIIAKTTPKKIIAAAKPAAASK